MNTAMQDRTKIMFAEQLETMLETMPLAKVRIVDLCKRCGTTPPTFYYYFHDKYELVAWIFLRDFADVCGDRAPEYSPEVIATILEHIERRRIFYIKAYQENSQNSINRYVQNFNVQLGKDTLKSLTGNKDISSEQLLSIKYHSYGIMGIFKEWLLARCRYRQQIWPASSSSIPLIFSETPCVHINTTGTEY